MSGTDLSLAQRIALPWLAAFGLVAGSMTVLGRLGGVWWPLDVAAHFPAQCAPVLAICVGGLWSLRRRKWAALAAIPLAINVALIAPVYVPPGDASRPLQYLAGRSAEAPGSPSGPTLRLLQFNVQMRNRRFADVAAYVEGSGADLVSVQETDRAWVDTLASGAPSYRVAVAAPQDDKHGLALLVRRDAVGLRMLGAQVIRLTPGAGGTPAVEARFEWAGRRLALLSLHPRPPINPWHPRQRDDELAAAERWARDQVDPVIIIGDLNATPWSAPFRRLVHGAGLVNSQRGFGLQPTWPKPLPVLATIPIDHVLHSPVLATLDRSLGPALGSDHRGVEVELTTITPPTP